MSKGISHCLLSSRAKRRRTKEEIKQAKESEQAEARRLQAKLEQHDQMQRQLDKQQQQMQQLWQENQDMKKVKEELVPNLMENGLLGTNPDTGNLQVAKNW